MLHIYLHANRNCSRGNTIKHIGNEEHLKGTFEQQMEYNKKTLQELNEILNDSSNKVWTDIILALLYCK